MNIPIGIFGTSEKVRTQNTVSESCAEKNSMKKNRTRSRIIEKTAPLFNRKGFAGTSLTDMTVATGLTKGSIYSNFKNKDEVALAVFDYNFQKLQDIILTEMRKEKTVRAQLLVYANVYHDFLKHPFLNAGCPIQNTATEADDTHPILRQRASDAITTWKQNLAKQIRKGIAMKEFRSDVNADGAAFAIIAMIEGGILISKLTGKRRDQKFMHDGLERLIMGL